MGRDLAGIFSAPEDAQGRIVGSHTGVKDAVVRHTVSDSVDQNKIIYKMRLVRYFRIKTVICLHISPE